MTPELSRGLVIVAVGMGGVFANLLLLMFAVTLIGKFFGHKPKPKTEKKKKKKNDVEGDTQTDKPDAPAKADEPAANANADEPAANAKADGPAANANADETD